MLENTLEIAIIVEQFAGSLLTDTWDARDVIRFVTDQSFEIGQLAGGQVIAVDDGCLVVLGGLADAALCHQSMHVLVDKLERIHVASEDNRINSHLRRLNCQGTQHIVSLETVFFVNGYVESLDYLANTPKLWAHDIWQRWSMSLVFDKFLVAESRCRPVKGDSNIVGFDFCQRFDEDRGKAKCRID